MFNDLSTKLAALFLCFFFLANDIMASVSALAHAEFRESSNREFVPSLPKEEKALPAESSGEEETTPAPASPKANVGSVTFFAEEDIAYLGGHEKDPLNMPGDDFFNIVTEENPENFQHAYISYQLKGISNPYQVAISINSEAAYMEGSKIVQSDLWKEALLEINPNDLRQGSNAIRYSVSSGYKVPIEIKNVQIILSRSNYFPE